VFFKNRTDAGNQLAAVVAKAGDFRGWLVIGLARGGVIIGAQIAKALSLPLASFYCDDAPIGKKTYAATGLGSVVAWGRLGRRIIGNDKALRSVPELAELIERVGKKQELYNNGSALEVGGKRIILCDDGIVSGRSAISAIDALRHAGAAEIILAVPVVPKALPEQVAGCRVIFFRRSITSSFATGMFYTSFDDVPDEEVKQAIAA
jgi:putative phosphoribosyl transferase